VYEMVKNGLLEPCSAQEVARLPTKVQFAFAETAVREGLPKSAIESLVAGYTDESCPDAVKTQILSDPRAALGRMADKRRAVNPGRHKASAPPYDIDGYLRAAKFHIATLRRVLFGMARHEIGGHGAALKELEAGLSDLLTIIRGLFSPGKTEDDHNAG